MDYRDENQYFLGIAKLTAMRSSCIHKKVGAVIVKDGKIVSIGCKDTPDGEKNCLEYQDCPCDCSAEDSCNCRAVHAAAAAIISASKSEMENAVIYIAAIGEDENMADPQPCVHCRRLIKKAGIRTAIGWNPATNSPQPLDLSTHNRPLQPVDLSKIKQERLNVIKEAWMQKMKETAQMTIAKRQTEVIHLFSQLIRLEYEPTIRFRQVEKTFPILFDSMEFWTILRKFHVGCSGGLGKDKHYEYIVFISEEQDKEEDNEEQEG